MDYETIKVSVDKGVATVLLNRPDRANAMNRPMWQELPQAFADLDRRPEVRAVILAGSGGHFCAGIDITMLAALQSESGSDDACAGRARENLRGFILDMQNTVNSIERCRKPVVAAIHGACIGAGIDLATACDLRYCAEGVRFSVKEIDMGLVADVGVLQRLPRLVGDGVTRELAYTGREVGAAEAERIGLVNRAYASPQELMKAMTELGATLAAKSPLVLRGTKHVITHARDHSVADSMEYVALWNSAMLMSEDLTEAVLAYQKKRAPVFRD